MVSKKPTQKIGIAIDQSQKEVLQNSYRTKEPNFLTAFSEDNYDLSPVDEETEKYSEVPSLDTLVDSCLVKRHGPKAPFAKSKHKSLATQPYKMLEKIALKGQQLARLGIVTLSRQGSVLWTEWSMNNSFVSRIFHFWDCPMMDLFATFQNKKTQLFCSRMIHQKAFAIDAMSMSWQNIFAYAFPQIQMIPRVLQHMKRYHCK